MDDDRRPPPGDTGDDARADPRSRGARPERLADVRRLEDLPLVLSIAEVAAVLGCDRRTVYALIRVGAFPARKVGSRWAVERDGVITWLRADRPRSKRS